MALSDTKDLILETASNLFYDKGYNLIGINEIIAKAGIAKATLYNHFRTKEDILLAYLDKMDQQLLTSLREFIAKKRSGNSRLIAVLEFLQTFYKQENFNGCWCIRSLAEVPRENEKVRNKIKINKSRLLNYIKLLVIENKPELKSKQQMNLAYHLYLLYESAVTESHLHDDSWPIDEAIKIFKRRLKQQIS